MTERMLNALEIMTCADLYQKRAILRILFTPVSVQSFLCICLGIGSAEVYRCGNYKFHLYIFYSNFLHLVHLREKVSVLKGVYSLQTGSPLT